MPRCSFFLHALKETAAAGFTTGESLCLPQFDRHHENGKKWASFCQNGYTVTPLAIYYRIYSELRSQSENGIRDRTLVDVSLSQALCQCERLKKAGGRRVGSGRESDPARS